MSLCVVDGLHCRCQPPEVPCDGVVKLNAEIERMKGEIAAKDATISAAVRGESIACDALRQRIAEKDAEIATLKSALNTCVAANNRWSTINKELNAEIARLQEGWAKLSLYADEGWAVFQHIRRQAAEGKYGDKLRNEIIAPQATATIEPPA